MANAYWEARARLRQLAYDRSANNIIRQVSAAYDSARRQLNRDIDDIIGSYTRQTGLTAKQALDYLNGGVPVSVLDGIRARLVNITNKAERRRLEVILNTSGYRARISRLDAILDSARVGLTEAADVELRLLTPHLQGIAETAYSRMMYDVQFASGYGFQMAGVPSRALSEILKSHWAGINYSDRIWANRDSMVGLLKKAIMEQSSIGKLSDATLKDIRGSINLDKWKAQLKSKFKDEAQYAKYASNRLIRTETAYVSGQTTAVAYDECGIERYEFISVLDGKTSQKCSGLDGQVFKLDEMEVGVNYPPVHPFCRSSVAPVLDTQNRKTMQRRGEGKDGKSVLLPADMNYSTWKRWQNDGCPEVSKWMNKRIE